MEGNTNTTNTNTYGGAQGQVAGGQSMAGAAQQSYTGAQGMGTAQGAGMAGGQGQMAGIQGQGVGVVGAQGTGQDAQQGGVQVAGRFYTDEELDNMNEDQVLDLFVEKMIEDKGMGGLEEGLKNEVRTDLKERLVFQINRAIIAALPDDKYEELDKSLDDKTATAESLNQIVAESGVNVAGITQKTMEEFRALYLSTNANTARG